MDRYFDLRPIDFFVKNLNMLWWYYLFLGLVLVLLGAAIIVWPDLLIALVAAVFIFAGTSVLALSWRVWRLQRQYRAFKRDLIGV
jgi:uncharacterized membrane protein HdeD (DUF308 family)